MVAAVLGVILLCLAATTRGFEVVNDSTADNDVAGPIVGGGRVRIEQFPHQLYMKTDVSRTSYSACGASIIGKTWAMTAAHCCFTRETNRPYQARQITLRSGSKYSDRGGQVHKVAQVKIHERYSPRTSFNDICLLRVANPFQYNSATKVIRLPNSNSAEFYRPRKDVFVSGWGRTSEEGESSDLLLGVKVQLISDQECRQTFPNLFHQGQVCAYTPGKSSCYGDSGGALISRGKALGIVSGGRYCGNPSGNTPSFYTKVGSYRSWIRGITGI